MKLLNFEREKSEREGGRIEWKNHRKAPPIYVGPDSYHDPAVIGAIMPGGGHRLRITDSKNEYFEESVNDAAKGFAISGYNYQKAKQELLKFKDQDPVELIKRPRREKKKPEKGVQAFFRIGMNSFRIKLCHIWLQLPESHKAIKLCHIWLQLPESQAGAPQVQRSGSS